MADLAAAAEDANDVFEGLGQSRRAGVESERGGWGGGARGGYDVAWEEAAEERVGVGDGDGMVACCGGDGKGVFDRIKPLKPLPVRV